MPQSLCDPKSLVSVISAFSGGASFASNLVATIPQLIETYQQKSVEGLSLVFVSIWVIGDITSFLGCFLTDQLFFQYVLALYFLFTDVIMAGQYYYYGFYLKKHHHHQHHNHHHHHHHHQQNQGEEGTEYGATGDNSKKSSGSLVGAAAKAAVPVATLASNVGQSNAYPIGDFIPTATVGGFTLDSKTYGVLFAWLGAGLYFFSRIPQLVKNYQRKSTEDISPVLFACTLFGNLTYAISIMVSCEFIYGEDRWQFFINELPYLIGSAGTIVFDLFYFYQVWLYRDSSAYKNTETQPLLNSD